MIRGLMTIAAASIACSFVAAPSLSAQDGGTPSGWSIQPDGQGKAENVKLSSANEELRVTLGPAAILYRSADTTPQAFHTQATFTQTKAPPHPEGYGLFYAGKGLGTAEQQYIYFLVRGDGQYLIKQRNGAETPTLKPWTAHPAIKKAEEGKATNVLEIDAKRQAGKVLFLANGTVVDSLTVSTGESAGVVGIRANHNLDLIIKGFVVHR